MTMFQKSSRAREPYGGVFGDSSWLVVLKDTNRINNLNVNALSAYTDFQSIAGELINTPKVHRVYFEGGEFRIELGWFANANLSLQTRTDLSTGDWLPAGDAVLNDNGSGLFIFTDAGAPATQCFYRVESN